MKEAKESLAKMIERFPNTYYAIAVLFSTMGEPEMAMDWLEKAYINKNKLVLYINVDPEFKKLRDNIRFRKIIERMNFPK